MQYYANHLEVSHICGTGGQQIGRAFLRPKRVGGRCMTRYQFVFNVGREGIKGLTDQTRLPEFRSLLVVLAQRWQGRLEKSLVLKRPWCQLS